jgi:prepilin-type N-terminal cleavage/methylation domain-containing protein
MTVYWRRRRRRCDFQLLSRQNFRRFGGAEFSGGFHRAFYETGQGVFRGGKSAAFNPQGAFNMLKQLMAMTKAELKSKLQAIDLSTAKGGVGRSLRRKFEAIRSKKEGGFTLLELLVVVLILAAIAGTATIMLQDTDRRGAAGAHVAMMDELSKGIQTYKVLNQNKYPDVWESLLAGAATAKTAWSAWEPLAILSADLLENIEKSTLTNAQATSLREAGITKVRLVDTTAKPESGKWDTSDTPCANTAEDAAPTNGDIKATILSKDNDVVATNIYRPVGARGCGFEEHVAFPIISSTTVASTPNGDTNFPVYKWKGNPLRVGVPVEGLGSDVDSDNLIAVGVGPDSTLFNPAIIGALSNTPIYRHVENWEYNHFIVIWNTSNGPATFQAIIDGAGDTKDEELGEIDGVRPT